MIRIKRHRSNLPSRSPTYFGIDDQTARRIANEVGHAVASWRNEAQRLGIREAEIDRMASAFEHADLRLATKHP